MTRTRRALGVALVLSFVAAAVGWYATRQRLAAEEATRTARIQEEAAKESSELARAESERADSFVRLVSSHPAGQRAMEKICLEAIDVTATLATTTNARVRQQARDRFLELYYAPMYIVELHQRKQSGNNVSRIEGTMIRFKDMLESVESSRKPLPHASLCTNAKDVRDGCVEHLKLTVPEAFASMNKCR